jgi:hypothetical protein
MGLITKHAMKDLQAKQKKNKAVVTCMPCVTHATIAGQAAKTICLAAPASPSPVTTEQAQATKTTSIILGKLPLIRGCLLLDALAWPQQLQVESEARI